MTNRDLQNHTHVTLYFQKMKVILFCLLLTLFNQLFAQEEIQSVKCQMGKRKNESKEWRWTKVKVCKVKFILDDSEIRASDKANSVYTTYQTIEARDKKGVWKAYDEKGKHCVVTIQYGYPMNTVEIVYSDTYYLYFFNI